MSGADEDRVDDVLYVLEGAVEWIALPGRLSRGAFCRDRDGRPLPQGRADARSRDVLGRIRWLEDGTDTGAAALVRRMAAARLGSTACGQAVAIWSDRLGADQVVAELTEPADAVRRYAQRPATPAEAGA